MVFRSLVIALFISVFGFSGELPVNIQVKFIKIIAGSVGIPSVACKDSSMATELRAIGISVDNSSKVVYVSTDSELAQVKGKFVIVTRLELLPKGGAIAIVEEGGKPAIYLHMGNIAASGVTLSDTILKIGKRL